MATGPERVERRLAAIFAADVAGYSKLMGADEVSTLRSLSAHREIMDRRIAEHGGRIANTAGDSVLAEFPSTTDAVQCAVDVQHALNELNVKESPDRALRFRIGVHVGDVIIKKGDLFGDSVNVAARCQTLAEPGGICLSGDAYRHVRKTLSLTFNDLGPQRVKNIDGPVTAYAVVLPASTPTVGRPQPVEPEPLPPADKPSIAVLPFTNLSGDAEQNYFSDGIVEEIITALYRVKWLIVVSRKSSFAYRDRGIDAKRVGQELGVRYLLEGSVRRAGNRVRITGQLIEAASGRHVWADRFEGMLEDIFELQDRITENVVGAVEPTIRSIEVERAKAKPTEILDAYDLYLRALPLHYSNNRERLAQAQRLLARAVAIDPTYSVAKAFSALTTVIQANQGWSDEAEREHGTRLAREALADHRDDPVTLRCVGHALAYLAHEHDLAVSLLDRALTLHPNSAEVHHSAGWVWNFVCDGSTALEHFNRAIRLSPLDPEIGHTLVGVTFSQLLMERYEAALETSRRAMAAMPTSISPLRAAIIALVELRSLGEARKVGETLLAINPGFRIGAFRRVQPFKDEAFVERYLAALRSAGLPD